MIESDAIVSAFTILEEVSGPTSTLIIDGLQTILASGHGKNGGDIPRRSIRHGRHGTARIVEKPFANTHKDRSNYSG